MKKFLKRTAVILLSLLILFVGTFKYRQYKANQVLIPKNSSALVKISVDEIYKTLAANVMTHPVYYFKTGLGKDSLSKTDKFENGLEIPASLYFYTISGKPSTTFFSRLEIKDIEKFEAFLHNTLHLQTNKKAKVISIAKSHLGNFVICYNNKSAAFVLATQIENYEPVLIDILNEKDFGKIGDSQFKNLLNRKEHLAFGDEKTTGWIDFKSGEIIFKNDFSTNEIFVPVKNKHRVLNNNATINLWFNANFKTTENKTYKYKSLSLERDSLLKYYNGNLDFEWTNSIQKTDSIITYEYNDDFEKVEKISLQKVNIPQFSLNIGTKVDGLKNYLAEQGLINLDSNLVNKTTFPLYKVFVASTADDLNFSTEKNYRVSTDRVSADDFLYLNIDFIKLSKQLEMPIITNYFKVAKRLKLKGKFVETNKISVNGTLQLKNEDINSLYQILTSF